MDLEPGIPSKCESSTHADYVPALDTALCAANTLVVCTRGTMRSEMIRKSRGCFVATPSNCRKFLKLYLPSWHGNIADGRVNYLGYGKNDRDDQKWEMDNLQPSPTISPEIRMQFTD